MTLKMALLAPIPSASAATAMAVKPGARSSMRIPKRKSCTTPSVPPNIHWRAELLKYWRISSDLNLVGGVDDYREEDLMELCRAGGVVPGARYFLAVEHSADS